MPSGSKKRKAAKKKKLNQSHGVDDLKHQEEDKESDIREVSSPTSQDHYSSHAPSIKGDEEIFEEGRNITNLPSIKESKTEENVVRVDRELTIEEKPDKKDEIFEHDETDKGSLRSSSSSSNSSDDEPHGNKSSRDVADISPVVDQVASTFDPKECVVQESNDHEKHFEIPEMLLARGPRAVLQATSFKSCCGLFEVFAGSDK